MAEPRKKTLSYHRAEYFVDDTTTINLGMCVKQATDNIKTANQRIVSRAGGQTIRLALSRPDADRKGVFLHLTVDTPGEHTSIVPKVPNDSTEIKVGTVAPPNDAEYMDGDAFLYVRGNDVCLCSTVIRLGAVREFLSLLSGSPSQDFPKVGAT